jgi:hypothetical protein
MSTLIKFGKPAGTPGEDTAPENTASESGVPVSVLFTSTNQTIRALEHAEVLASRTGAGVNVVAALVVPFPLPLDRPPVPFEFIIRRFEELTKNCARKTQICTYLCRDPVIALKTVLDPKSPVIMGVREKSWWPSREKRFARKLRRAGYEVILVEAEA